MTIRWQGKLHPSGKVFRTSRKETFKLDDSSIFPFWKRLLMGNENNAMGGRGMGEGETAQFILPPELAFGAEGHAKWGVPPNSSVLIKVRLQPSRPPNPLLVALTRG